MLHSFAKFGLCPDLACRIEPGPDADSQPIFVLPHGFRSTVFVIASVPTVSKAAECGELLAPFVFAVVMFSCAGLRAFGAFVARLDGVGPNGGSAGIAVGRRLRSASGIERRWCRRCELRLSGGRQRASGDR